MKTLSNFAAGQILSRQSQKHIIGGTRPGEGVECSITCTGDFETHKIKCTYGCAGSDDCIECSNPQEGEGKYCCPVA